MMTNYQPQTMLVTGAAGFIGSNYVRMILSRYTNIQIVSFDKLTYAGSLDNLQNLPNSQNHCFIQGDITDADQIAKVLREYTIDTIVHFAAESHVDNSIESPQVFVETNVLGTFVLLEQARVFWQDERGLDSAECRFHHISTDEVYGTLGHDEPAFKESTAYAPNSPYSASKAGSDHLVRAYYHTYQLPITMSNCSNNYGPYQHPEKLIPVVIDRCLQGKPIPVYGDGSNIRDWLYVEDHCDAVDCIIRQGQVGEVYNIGGDNEIDNLTLVKMICHMMDEYQSDKAPHRDLIHFVEDRQGHDWRYAIDSGKMYYQLGWQPSQNFEAMLQRTIEFYVV